MDITYIMTESLILFLFKRKLPPTREIGLNYNGKYRLWCEDFP